MNIKHTKIVRRKSRQIMVGDVAVGGDAPISVQSMTNTDTTDIEKTLAQVNALADAGADIVRISTPSIAAAEAFSTIRQQVSVPLVADIHFDYKIALKVADGGADCLRINPGNIGKLARIQQVVEKAKALEIPIRIGVNAGSLEKNLLNDTQGKYIGPTPAAMVESAMRHVDILENLDFTNYKLSLKASEIFMTVEAYRQIANKIDCPLHLGITEAGSLRTGTVKSAAGLGLLLNEGIGDTLRISLAADPVEEVRVAWDLLKSFKLRNKGVNLIACPSCSRQNFDVIKTVNELEHRLEDIKTPIDVAVIGCYVNGPGESREATIGLTGAGQGLEGKMPHSHAVYQDGKIHKKVATGNIVDELENMVRAKVAAREELETNMIASNQ